MKTNRVVALMLTCALSGSTPAALFAQQSTSLAGTAKDEAKKPYTDYTVRARDVKAGTIAATVVLDNQATFSLGGLTTERYLVELVNKDGKVVCTEGPFDMAKQAVKSDVVIDCGKVPIAWWLLGAAAGAGITAGAIASNPASPSR
ncbi:MAG: hypothetical protein JSU08_06280 [Acidobacteria bacterium]|nr:hypothetical protein [Acidobacteriota bacterium]